MNVQHYAQHAYSEAFNNDHIYPLARKDSLPVMPGKILIQKLSTDPNVVYYLYIPFSAKSNAPVMVAVHGIQRRANQHVTLLAPFAERRGCVLIAPYFQKSRFRGYQQLGINRKGARADRALDRIINEVKNLTDANTENIYMFGYSGGAQFVSRYTMIYPHRVARIVLAAAGWYTYPDLLQNYPLGIKKIMGHREVKFHLMKILSVPTCVLVGEKDILRDRGFRKSEDIDQQQGINRLERNKRWVKSMQAAARANNLETLYDFQILAGCGHSFRECMQKGDMGSLIFRFLFDSN